MDILKVHAAKVQLEGLVVFQTNVALTPGPDGLHGSPDFLA